jgi:hypothetical protein
MRCGCGVKGSRDCAGPLRRVWAQTARRAGAATASSSDDRVLMIISISSSSNVIR